MSTIVSSTSGSNWAVATPPKSKDPKAATAAAVATPKASPGGTWRHPRLDEINQRISKRTFGERNVQAIFWNSLAFFASFALLHVIARFLPSIARLGASYGPYSSWILNLLRAGFVVNIVLALRPIISKTDDLKDIPLTPSQRSLLGLPLSSDPLTPGSHYSTPPRYARSTPRSGSSTRAHQGTAARSATSSPLSGRGFGSPADQRRQSPSNSPTPYARDSSPLYQRKFGEDTTRRLSYGSQSPLRTSNFLSDSTTSFGGSAISAPGTPTPATGLRSTPSVKLNNKWLYQRGRESPGRESY